MDAAAQLNTSLAGRYRIDREIGAGGMATVYLAHDARHDRLVALKVLNPELGAVLGVERFLAEIKVTANLQHPNLLPLFDSGEAAGLLFYVMPFVEGESLRARLTRERQLPVDEAVRITVAVAGALDYAHRHGVVHRDLKPENLLLHEGQPLVADFGIALAVSAAGGARMTLTGLSLGTPQYMAPEQAMGERTIDARADVYALGVVLYEMLVGEAPFTGPTSQAIVAKVITERAPRVTTGRASVPDHVAAALDMALEKVPADRFQSTADFAAALTQASVMQGRPKNRVLTPGRQAWWRDWRSLATMGVGVALAAALAVTLVTLHRGGASAAQPVVRSSLMFSAGEAPSLARRFAVSPEGSRLVYATGAAVDGGRLWIRSLTDGTSSALPGTEGATYPFWSPDGQTIGFFAKHHLLTVPAQGGATTVLAASNGYEGGSWNRDDVILFPGAGAAVYRVAATGGAPTLVMALDSSRRSQRRLSFLPDQRHFLFWDWTEGAGVVWMGDLEGAAPERFPDPAYDPSYVAPGLLLFSRPSGAFGGRSALVVQPFDLKGRALTGKPYTISALLDRGGNVGSFSFSDDVLAYANVDTLHDVSENAQPKTWWSRATQQSTPITTPQDLWQLRISHDGKRVAFGGFSLRVLDLARGTWLTIPTALKVAQYPVWSPGDSLLAYGDDDLRMIAINSVGSERRIALGAPLENHAQPTDWSPDGHTILILRAIPDTVAPHELWEYSMVDRRSRRVLNVPGDVSDARFSPDGHWIAYESDESGSHEIYLSRYPQTGAPIPVSRAGGGSPRWRRDGRELYFIAGDGRIMVSGIQLGDIPLVSAATVLVRDPVTPEPFFAEETRFDVDPSGERVLLQRKSFTPPILELITGWRGLVGRGTPER